MIHLETYAAASRTANSVWWKGEPPPEGLLNPTNYVEPWWSTASSSTPGSEERRT